VLWVPDTHVPYEDKRAFELMLKAMRAWKPDAINILGDFGDFYCVSSHSKAPDRVNNLETEVAAINARLDQLDALSAKEKRFVEGNHEWRLERYLADKAPELFGLVGVQELFRLKARGWDYTPYKQSTEQGRVSITHDCGNAGADAHRKAVATFQGNVVIGHTHRMSVHYEGSAKGKSHVGAMFGWLGDVHAVDYMHRVQALRAWQTGFGIGYEEPNGTVHVQAVPIIDYRLVLDGVLFQG
jgi:UDP-2,3-diacylglucosamine pyrophosphatase LpxH